MKPRRLSILVLSCLLAVPLFGQKKEEERLQNSATVLKEILGMPETIPR